MSTIFEENREAEHLRLSVSKAVMVSMLSEIPPDLRQIQFHYTFNTIHLDCYFDGVPSENSIENMSCIETILIASYYPDVSISHSIHRIDYPLPLPRVDLKNGGYAYARKEKLDSYNFMEQINALILVK